MKRRAPTMARSRGRTNALRIGKTKRPKSKSSRVRSTRGRSTSKSGTARRSAKATTDPEQIRRWVEERRGHPAIVRRTHKGGQKSGILRIDFPGFSGEGSLEPISWDEWFDIFEQRKLALLYQDRTASRKLSRFNKLVARE